MKKITPTHPLKIKIIFQQKLLKGGGGGGVSLPILI